MDLNFEKGLIRFKAVRIVRRRLLKMGFKPLEITPALMNTRRLTKAIEDVTQGILQKKGLVEA